MNSAAKYLRHLIPPWLIKYLPNWLINWLYPPLPALYYNIYSKLPYLVPFAISTIVSFYLIYKLYSIYGYVPKNDLNTLCQKVKCYDNDVKDTSEISTQHEAPLDLESDSPTCLIDDVEQSTAIKELEVNDLPQDQFDKNDFVEYDFTCKLELVGRLSLRYFNDFVEDILVENLSDYYYFQSSDDEYIPYEVENIAYTPTNSTCPPLSPISKLNVYDRFPQFINLEPLDEK